MAWSSLAAVVDASTGRRVVLSGLVLIGPVCVAFTGRWLRTALAGAWATGLVVLLGIPDGIAGTRLEAFLIAATAAVAVISTLALVVTLRSCLSVAVSTLLAACGGSHAPSVGNRAVSSVSCRREYETWKRGPVRDSMGSLAATLKAIDADHGSADAAAMKSELGQLVPIAIRLGFHPMPSCVDRADLWDQFVTRIYTAGDSAQYAKNAHAVRRAAASVAAVKKLGTELTAEAGRVLADHHSGS